MQMNLLFTAFMVMAAMAFLSVKDQAESLDISTVVNGTVKVAKGNSIEIMEGPNDKETQIEIDSNTVYDNVQKLTDLKAGDKVQVDYKINHDKKTAITVTKIEEENEDNI